MKYEDKKAKELKNLLDEWRNFVSKKDKVNNGQRSKLNPSDCFVYDGFFPGYYSEKKKILFIGRETRNSNDFVYTTINECFSNNGDLDKGHLNDNNNWWRHILKIFYGIKNEGISFKKVPSATKIAHDMCENAEFGFAVINISKYTNNSKKNWQTNLKLVHRFIEDSELEKTNFFQRELEILDPDVIISGNLWEANIKNEYLELCLPSERRQTPPYRKVESYNPSINYWKYDLYGNGKKMVDFINTYHFSARKKDKEDFYNPVMKVLFPK